MEIQERKKGSKDAFVIEENNEVIAELVYSRSGNNIIIQHTEVDEELRGRDIGYKLVNFAVDYARRHNLKILPVCRFAKAVFDKKSDFGDVLG